MAATSVLHSDANNPFLLWDRLTADEVDRPGTPCYRQQLEFESGRPSESTTPCLTDEASLTDSSLTELDTSPPGISIISQEPPLIGEKAVCLVEQPGKPDFVTGHGDCQRPRLTTPFQPDAIPKEAYARHQYHLATSWKPRIHVDVARVSQKIEDYFLTRWPFPHDRARRRFVGAGFPMVTCCYFPLAADDRIELACRLLTVLFLIDDILEYKSLADGERFNERLIQVIRGEANLDRSDASEGILHGIFAEMHTINPTIASDVMASTFTFMRAQTDRSRLNITELGQYLQYREGDVGKALLCDLMRFTMSLNLRAITPQEDFPADPALEPLRNHLRIIESRHAYHISIVNDIMSWEKEVRAAAADSDHHAEGAVLCNAVKVLGDGSGLSVNASKRVLWMIVREWERSFDEAAEKISSELGGEQEDDSNTATGHEKRVPKSTTLDKQDKQEIHRYVEGLRLQMSGNEYWSLTTPRYNKIED